MRPQQGGIRGGWSEAQQATGPTPLLVNFLGTGSWLSDLDRSCDPDPQLFLLHVLTERLASTFCPQFCILTFYLPHQLSFYIVSRLLSVDFVAFRHRINCLWTLNFVYVASMGRYRCHQSTFPHPPFHFVYLAWLLL